MSEPIPHVPARRAALAFIFVTVAIDILSFGIIIPVLPHLIMDMLGGNDFAKAAVLAGIFGTVFALVQFFASPIQGALSDHFGRRPVVLLSNLGIGIDFLFMALVNTLPLLFIGRIISGFTAASFTTANAYIADVTPPEKRAASFGMLGAAFGIGFVVGPALGGFLAGISPRLPFWAAAGLALTNFLYGYFVLPESLPKERRSPFTWRTANPLGSLALLRRYPQVFGLATIVLLSNLAHYVLPSTFVLYADYRYHWGAQAVGYTLALVGVCNAVVQAGLVRKLVVWLGERRMLATGLVCGTIGFAWQGLAPTGWLSLLAIPFLALWGMAGPATQALMTRQVDPHEQGRLQGAVTSLASFAGIFGPALFTQVFALSIVPSTSAWQQPGAAFVLAAVLLLAGFVLALRVPRIAPGAAVGESV